MNEQTDKLAEALIKLAGIAHLFGEILSEHPEDAPALRAALDDLENAFNLIADVSGELKTKCAEAVS